MLMAIFMKANEKTIKPTVLESIPIQMAQNMKAIERMTNKMKEEKKCGRMAQSMRGLIFLVKRMVRVSYYSGMDLYMKENSNKTKSKAMAFINEQMANAIQVSRFFFFSFLNLFFIRPMVE